MRHIWRWFKENEFRLYWLSMGALVIFGLIYVQIVACELSFETREVIIRILNTASDPDNEELKPILNILNETPDRCKGVIGWFSGLF